MNWTAKLRARGACPEAVEWANDYPSLATAWKACERGDWMLWLLGKTGGAKPDSAGRRKLVLTACACARTESTAARSATGRPS